MTESAHRHDEVCTRAGKCCDREGLALLDRCDLFAGIAPEQLASYLPNAALLDFGRGSLLIRQGDDPDAIFVIVAGSAEVFFETPDGGEELLDILSVGECIGDLAILLDEPRTASVRAIRHCQAVRIDRADLYSLQVSVPVFSLRLARLVAQRLDRRTRQRIYRRQVTDVAAILLDGSAHTGRVMADLAVAVAALPATPITFLSADASDQRHVASCLAEADAALIFADADAAPDGAGIARLLDLVEGMRPRPPVDLVLCHAGAIAPTSTRGWLSDGRLRRWHHARHRHGADIARIARLVAGCATGLALGGGGARGFAHIGVLMALQEAGVAVDYIAGASMGAIVAAQYAVGLGPAEMIGAARRAYLDRRRLPDLTFPSVALYSGRSTVRRHKEMFGERLIEDLPIPYFATAADLRRAEAVVLERGPVWRSTRISCALPGLLPPTEQDGRLLVDGGLLDNLPVGALRARCGGKVIASDVSVSVEFEVLPPRTPRRGAPAKPAQPGIGQILMRAAQLANIRDSRESGTPADLYLNPDLSDVAMTDFSRLTEVVERGADHAREMLTDWQASA